MEVCTVSGFNEVGKNMTAIKIGEEVVILDMGIHIPALVSLEGEDRSKKLTNAELFNAGAIPDEEPIADWKKDVKAIILGHCHLYHIGAIPYLASKYKCPIIGTPYTLQVLRAILEDEKRTITNTLRPISPNSKIKISENLSLELIQITHSTPQSSFITLYTPEGIIVYTLDYKFDNHPEIGQKPNYQQLRDLGKKGVKLLINESLYADREMKTPSEKVAKEMLKDVLLSVDNHGKAVFVTTFASHIARIKTVIELAEKLKRKVVILGRSMSKYIKAAEDVKIVNFTKKALMGSYREQTKKLLTLIRKNPSKYLVICTGNQAEPGSVLDRLVNKEFDFKFEEGDHVIFSCKTIPDPLNIANRKLMEAKLKKQKVRIFTEIHTSGHASREDHRDLINFLKPTYIIPAHGDSKKEAAMAQLAEEIGYKIGKNVFLMADGQKIVL